MDTPRPPEHASPPPEPRTTLRTLRQWVSDKQPFAMLTCYDATTARWLYRGGVRTLLVGDTAAQMILGLDSTLGVSMDFMVAITAAVRRGAPQALLMADMPFGSYQAGQNAAVANAIRFLTEGQADCVKLEVDRHDAALVRRLSRAGVPVVAHIGARPQQVRHEGRFRAQGKLPAEAAHIVEDAEVLTAAGADVLLIEAVPNEVTDRVVNIASQPDGTRVPVIGCGAGSAAHGHVVVLQDLLGLTDWHPPFAQPSHHLGPQIQEAASQWVERVASGQYLRDDHPYRMEH